MNFAELNGEQLEARLAELTDETSEEKRGSYLREYTALQAFLQAEP